MSELVRSIKLMLSELEHAKAHCRIHNDLTAAVQNKPIQLVRYHDFFELTIQAHFSAMILCVARLLDRDRRTRSIYWLLEYVEAHPDQFKMVCIHTNELRDRLDKMSSQVRKLRQIRNRWVAHRERVSESESKQFWKEHALTQSELSETVEEINRILKAVTQAHRDYDWRFTMIAIDEETEELINVLSERCV